MSLDLDIDNIYHLFNYIFYMHSIVDWIFCSVWAILSIVGIALQYRLRSKEVPFPQSPLIFYRWRQKRKNIELINTNNGLTDHITEDANAGNNGIEQSPLLGSEKHSYGTNW